MQDVCSNEIYVYSVLLTKSCIMSLGEKLVLISI